VKDRHLLLDQATQFIRRYQTTAQAKDDFAP